jgi:uncharacterized protein (TIGR03000 family)
MRTFIGGVILAAVGFGVSTEPSARAQAPDESKSPVIITMVLPADAAVSFDGTKTAQTGTLRRYYSPPIPTGKTFKYHIDVVVDGQEVKRSLSVRGGERITLDFRGGQVRERRGTGSAFFEPEMGAVPPRTSVPTFISPRPAAPLSPESPRNVPWSPNG